MCAFTQQCSFSVLFVTLLHLYLGFHANRCLQSLTGVPHSLPHSLPPVFFPSFPLSNKGYSTCAYLHSIRQLIFIALTMSFLTNKFKLPVWFPWFTMRMFAMGRVYFFLQIIPRISRNLCNKFFHQKYFPEVQEPANGWIKFEVKCISLMSRKLWNEIRNQNFPLIWINFSDFEVIFAKRNQNCVN